MFPENYVVNHFFYIIQENYTVFNRDIINGTTRIKAVDENREKSIGLLCAL